MPKFRIHNLLLSMGVWLGSSVALAEDITPPKEYLQWLETLKTEMIERGISEGTIEEVYEQSYYHPKPEVVKIDRNQTEFVLTFTDYVNRVVNKKKVENAQVKYKELLPLFQDLEAKYNVPFNYLVAFWGMETNFGQIFGNYQVVDALTTLSYDTRRPKFFREELYQALKIIDTWDMDYTKMEGSWAGAMGHFQFMPSTFNAYAIDYNGDGKIDIWHSFEDAVASAANYLQQAGWKKGEPWGMEVSLPWNFDYALTGRHIKKTAAFWKKIGVKPVRGAKLPQDGESLWAVIVPEGKKGKAFLVGQNFDVIMKWNRSENYALAIGILADYIQTQNQWKAYEKTPAERLKSEDVMKIQAFLNKLGFGNLAEDGQLGSKTRMAICRTCATAKITQPEIRSLRRIKKRLDCRKF